MDIPASLSHSRGKYEAEGEGAVAATEECMDGDTTKASITPMTSVAGEPAVPVNGASPTRSSRTGRSGAQGWGRLSGVLARRA